MAKTKPYTARSLPAAQAKVRSLQKQLHHAHEILSRVGKERDLLAKLAAKGPAFNDPLEAWEAEALRDRILKTVWHLNPDGSFID